MFRGDAVAFILYVHEDASDRGRQLNQMISMRCQKTETAVFQTLETFRKRLRKGISGDDIVVLFADTRQRLEELVPLRTRLEGTRIVIVLPDDEHDTLSLAVQFYPRFFTSIDTDYSILCEVLDKVSQYTNG